ncbi:FAD-binding protein [Rhodococcus hoagii]|nr:FAD-binding protein [Prescottella equi]
MSEDNWDVVVIGGGGAGLAAAVSAAEQGASGAAVRVADRTGRLDATVGGMFTAAGTSVQRGLGIEDTAEKFFQHYMDLNHWMLKPGLVRAFCENSGPTLEWLIGLGVEIPARESANAHMPVSRRPASRTSGAGTCPRIRVTGWSRCSTRRAATRASRWF